MGTLTIIYGTAMRVADGERDDRVRVYVHESGATYWGDETHELEHVCSQLCADAALNVHGPREDGDYELCADSRSSFLALATDGDETKAATADVTSADYGDDPYVLCASCGAELYRDDAAYEAAYGTSIPTNTEES